MANKREFKKYVEALSSAVCTQLAAVYMHTEDNAEAERLEKEIAELLAAAKVSAARANAHFDRNLKSFNGDGKAYRKAKKDFFNALYTNLNNEMNKKVQDGIKILNAAEKD